MNLYILKLVNGLKNDFNKNWMRNYFQHFLLQVAIGKNNIAKGKLTYA